MVQTVPELIASTIHWCHMNILIFFVVTLIFKQKSNVIKKKHGYAISSGTV